VSFAVPFLFDTNHAIAHLNADPRLVPHMEAAKHAGESFSIPTVVLGELYFGAYASQRVTENLAKLAAFTATLPIHELDAATAEEFGRLKAEQRLKGKPIPTADAQIAATARRRGLVLLSDDAHFEGIAGLVVQNWLS
jgi:tRNA(fMet)-specific endonuclease VapC